MSILGQRIKEQRKQKGLTQTELGKVINVGKSTISQYESGSSSPDYETLAKLADFFRVSTDYLLGRADHSLPPVNYTAAPASIPIYSRIAAVASSLVTENIIGYGFLPAGAGTGDYFFLRVDSDRMAGARIRRGDLVLVRRQEEIQDGRIGIVAIKDAEPIICRVYLRESRYILTPENPAYRPEILPRADVDIIGEIVEVKFKVYQDE